MRSLFKDKVLLITGGTGSFGNAVLRRFLDSDIKEIRILSRDEKKKDDMRNRIQNPKVKYYIGNVRDKRSVDVAIRGVDYVFAAAIKQVPSYEFFPIEATWTNVEGTNNVLLSAIEHRVKNVVVLSTDKAAYPINAMGISKALMEKVAIAKGRELGENAETTICCTRYGNVMASRGSVIPLWVDQMVQGKPITITDPNMTRFMMILHDCCPFTGHCAYYTFANCNRWKTRSHNCPEKNSYPSSLLLDRSFQNFEDKKNSFLGLSNLTLIPVSDWLAGEVKKSFLKDYQIKVIKNGINLDIFKPLNLENFSTKYEILGVANVWDKRKGLDEFIKLRKLLPENYNITLVGLNKKQIKNLPSGIKGLQRTENIYQLVELYNKADVFVNPTLEDNYPTTNLEASACGIPVITYDTGGSPEAIDDKTGIVVPSGNINILASKIKKVCEDNPFSSLDCRNRAKFMFDKNKSFLKYIDLYEILLNK